MSGSNSTNSMAWKECWDSKVALLLVPFNLKPQSGKFGFKKDTLDDTASSLLVCVGTLGASYGIRFRSENGVVPVG